MTDDLVTLVNQHQKVLEQLAAAEYGGTITSGAPWYNGSGVPSAGLGSNGDYYLDYDTGDLYYKSSGAWSNIGSVLGPTGATGATGATGSPGLDGAVWYTSSGAPSAGTGANGDFDLDVTTGDIYKKVTGSWVLQMTITGSSAPVSASYLTLATNANLTNERVFTPQSPLSASDGGAGGNYTLSIDAASESAAGKIELATQTETDTGTDDTRAVTSLKLLRYGKRDNKICDGRLTLTTATPVTTSDVTAATTIYFTPYAGNRISVYDGTYWKPYTFSELSLSLSGFTADKNSDVFIYDNAGTLTLERAEWTDDTTRATALVLQDGVLVKSGATTRRYLGSFRTTGTTGQCESSITKRFVWNYYNRVVRHLTRGYGASHTYNTATFRPFNNSAANSQVVAVIGVAEDSWNVATTTTMTWAAGNSTANFAVGVNSTSSPATAQPSFALAATLTLVITGGAYSIAGYNYVVPLEYANAAGTAPTFLDATIFASIPM